MHDSERDFERFAEEFKRLAETDKERELGRQVAELYGHFKTLGDEIVSLARRRNDNPVLFRKDVTEIDDLIDEKLQPEL